MQAFYRLTNPDGPDGLSVIQALVMKGDLSTTETILRFSPSSLDISIALLTAGTADFLISRMLAYVNLSPVACSPDKLPIEENSSSEAVLHILNKTVKKFQNISLLREVVSKGSLSQLQKVLAGFKNSKRTGKVVSRKQTSEAGHFLCRHVRLVIPRLWSFSLLMEQEWTPETTNKGQLCTFRLLTTLLMW